MTTPKLLIRYLLVVLSVLFAIWLAVKQNTTPDNYTPLIRLVNCQGKFTTAFLKKALKQDGQTMNNLSTTKNTKIEAQLSTEAWKNLSLKRRTSNSVEKFSTKPSTKCQNETMPALLKWKATNCYLKGETSGIPAQK